MATPPRTNTGWKAFGGVPPANHPAYRSAEGRTQETRKEKTGEPEGGHMDEPPLSRGSGNKPKQGSHVGLQKECRLPPESIPLHEARENSVARNCVISDRNVRPDDDSRQQSQ
jgi:hypothetical protein